ncbi:MAG: hypothetical protein ACI4UO_04650, partial [Paludibacteraceae bacterium]
SLSKETVTNKVLRMYRALKSVGVCPTMYPKALFVSEWREKGYRDFKFDNFHFAYRVCTTEDGEQIVSIEDVRHDLLFHD